MYVCRHGCLSLCIERTETLYIVLPVMTFMVNTGLNIAFKPEHYGLLNFVCSEHWYFAG